MLSDPNYHTDYVCVSLDILNKPDDDIDMFSALTTLDTLIKSTVRRVDSVLKPRRRDTKIILLVMPDIDVKLLRQMLKMPYIYAVARVLEREEDISEHIEYIENLISGELTHDPKVLELLKPKKKSVEKNKNVILLTVRQAQILLLIQERGASNKTMARMLNLSESTIKLHVSAILKKYGVKNRTQLAVFSKETT